MLHCITVVMNPGIFNHGLPSLFANDTFLKFELVAGVAD